MVKLKYIIFPLLITSILVTMSCQIQTTNTKKSIVVTYSILGSIVKELVGDKAIVTVSIPNGLDPHEWEPSARDIETINKADIIIENGLGLEGGMEKTLQIARNKDIFFFTATDHITVRHVRAGEGIPSGDPDQALGAPDPHFWLDPISMKDVVVALTSTLRNNLNIDASAQAKVIETRLDNLNDAIINVVSEIPMENRKLVTGHESMGYFAQRYGFQLTGVIIPSLSTQAAVSVADLAELKKIILATHVKTIFSEIGNSPAIAQTIANETGVSVVELTTHVLPPDGSYYTFMQDVANTIANGLK
jgi:zinc/manganese transport system substrate-binding protein